MSYYFSNAAKKQGLLANPNLLRKLQCSICPLSKIPNKHPKIEPEGNRKGSVYIIGLGPGPNEDAEGHFWVGAAGQYLRAQFSQDQWRDIRYNNVTRCREPDNKPPIESIIACSPFLEKDILEVKPKAIFGFGAVAVRWLLQANHDISITDWRGHPFPVQIGNHTCWAFPMHHPAYLLREAGHLMPVFKMDIDNAYKFLAKNKVPRVYTDRNEILSGITVCKTVSDVRVGLHSLRNEVHVAVDLETQGKRPYALDVKMLCVAIGTFKNTIVIPLEHRQSKWIQAELKEVYSLILEFLLELKILKIAHNLAFELEWLCVKLSKLIIRSNWADTMASAFSLGFGGQGKKKKKEGNSFDDGASEGDEVFTGLLSLDNQCKLHYGFFLKSLFHLNMNQLDWEDLDELCIYNGADTKWTDKLHDDHMQQITDENLQVPYQELVRRTPTLVLAQIKGLPINKTVAEEWSEKCTKRISQLYNGINKHPSVLEFKATHKKFEPTAPEDVTALFKSLNYNVTKTDAKGKTHDSSDDEILSKIDHVVASSVLTLREYGKLKSTYIDPLLMPDKKYVIWPDGLIHTQYTSLFTATTRVSSRFPNVQNYPSHKNKEIRAVIEPPTTIINGVTHVYVLVKNDFGQLEFRVMAMASKDRKLVKYIFDGYDVHADWCRRWATKYPDTLKSYLARSEFKSSSYPWKNISELLEHKCSDKKCLYEKVMKSWRGEVKNEFVFAKFYGAGDKKISVSLKVPIEYAKVMGEDFWNEFGDFKNWQEEVQSNYNKFGYVESLLKGRRYAFIDHGQVINTPIQWSACDIVMDGYNRLSEYAEKTGQDRFIAPLQIHDDLTFFLPKESWEEDEEFIGKEMVSCKFEYINVPLIVEPEVGPNWANTSTFMLPNTNKQRIYDSRDYGVM